MLFGCSQLPLIFIIYNLEHDHGLKLDLDLDLNFDLDSKATSKIISKTLVTNGLASLDQMLF